MVDYPDGTMPVKVTADVNVTATTAPISVTVEAPEARFPTLLEYLEKKVKNIVFEGEPDATVEITPEQGKKIGLVQIELAAELDGAGIIDFALDTLQNGVWTELFRFGLFPELSDGLYRGIRHIDFPLYIPTQDSYIDDNTPTVRIRSPTTATAFGYIMYVLVEE